MKITLVFLFFFALFTVIATAKGNKKEALKEPEPEKATKKHKKEAVPEDEEKPTAKKHHKTDPVDKVLAKQQRRLEKLNREAEIGQAPAHVPSETHQDPKDQQPKLKVKTPKVLMTPEQYETFLKEKAAERTEKQVMKRQKLLVKAEQMINEIEMLDALECHRNSQAENFDHLVNGGSQQEAIAKCREPSEVLRNLKERVEALRLKEEEKKNEKTSEMIEEKTD